MRLIDADVLKADVLEWENCYNGFSDTYDKARIIDAIDEQPTIEAEPNSCKYWDSESHFCALRRPQAEPVRRGHWVGIDDYPYETWECDQCGYIHEELGGWVPRYCPDCGAKMEEGEE